MRDIVNPLPYRRPELVSRPLDENGSYLVRNRQEGESFALGAEEHFLLSRLDGQHTCATLCAAFAERFGEALTDEDLDEFLHLARARGFLQPEQMPPAPIAANGFHERLGKGLGKGVGSLLPERPEGCFAQKTPDPFSKPPAWTKRLAARVLNAVAALLRWLAGLLGSAAGKIEWLRLTRLEFVPRPDDIFIVTYPRSGTTWMQMILYQLTTDGNMAFPHINEYCPWFEESVRSADGFEGRPSPRLFKSHLSYRQIPKGPCKYVYIARDGKDVAVSYFHFFRSHFDFHGTFDQFFELFMQGKVKGGSWFEHVRGWWNHRNDPNVLFLRYEDLLQDLEGSLRRIIAFCGLEVDPGKRASSDSMVESALECGKL